MGEPLYSQAIRIVACQRCGAPLEAAVQGGLFTCAYCGATNQLAARVERSDGKHAHDAPVLSESERYTRLREQERAGEALPASIAALVGPDGRLAASSLDRAKQHWLVARSQVEAKSSFPVQERFFHLTVLLAPCFAERARRAVLETAAEILPDERHRHVLRCLLATYAARDGDTESAEAWLSACDPRPFELSMDSSYRLAAATVASARLEHGRTLELLGMRDDDVPLAPRDRLACAVLRVHALESVGRIEDATAALRARLTEHGEPALRAAILEQRPLRVCDVTWTRIAVAALRAQVRNLEDLYGSLRRSWFGWPKLVVFLITAAAIAVGGGSVWAGCASALGFDPLLGAHADLVCPRLCAGCRGPYRHVRWTVADRTSRRPITVSRRLCENPEPRLAPVSEYAVSEARWYGTTIGVFTPLGLAGGVLVLAWDYRWRVRRRHAIEERLAEARARLARIAAAR